MNEKSVGVRELKSQLSKYLHRVKAGETIVITDRGKPIGRIIPEGTSLDEKVQWLIDSGMIGWSGDKLEISDPIVANESDILVSDIVAEMRE
ncbi:MAG: type II toxin-antitoxin system prevent-host-death family antitoxin [Candidatus Promineofilum sp.]|nr:type II toxin-antitoxin system prevent-host-death family antitoxin [Promineifilum sp.]MBW7959766.1 type II toxin-antitoxin system prevent-host-death family antitoxin [Promineifilum sp.]